MYIRINSLFFSINEFINLTILWDQLYSNTRESANYSDGGNTLSLVRVFLGIKPQNVDYFI